MAALEDLRRAEDNNVPYLNQPKYCFSKNRCATSIWATLWMSSSGTSLTANVEILGFMGNSIVGGVCSLTSEALVNLNKGVSPPAYFDWRGWFRAGLPSSGMTLRCSALMLPHGSR
ncbi:hypothetical protein J6590_093841 [Homalodisca vitripennis]|nr:hypothetical protein J6590_093841 [Homalodisca vitripennis]